jgi:hypothetical protein
MKKLLQKNTNLYHIKDGIRIEGVHENISGNVNDIRGDVSGISGNLDDCEITDEEREKGININDLIA